MRIEINIRNSHFLVILLFIIAVSAVGLVVAYGGINPSVMGHSWGEISCPGCITNTNLAGNSVTGAKIQDGTVTGADIQDSSIASGDIASIDGTKVTGTVPNSDTVDGKHAADIQASCGWSGWGLTPADCTGCTYCGTAPVTDLYCSGGKVTSARVVSVLTSCTYEAPW